MFIHFVDADFGRVEIDAPPPIFAERAFLKWGWEETRVEDGDGRHFVVNDDQ